LWFVAGDGVSIIDPHHLPFNKLPPPVHIEQITAARKAYLQNSPGDSSSNLRLPPLVRDLEIDYTALSLVAPEKNRFKYRLEGYDRDWQDAGNRRQAFYTNLSPRNYRFHVIASNNSGVWNEAGDSLDFSIDPAYYQTTWFQASCVAAFLALLWALYRYRLHQIAREFNAHLEGRVDERMRVARELHDTLLQSFQGSLLVMGAARNLLSRHPEQAGQTLDRAINMAAGAVAEGRGAIQDLRPEPAADRDLVQLLTAMGQELAGGLLDARQGANRHSPLSA
jgi:signal transduction histidine kinase